MKLKKKTKKLTAAINSAMKFVSGDYVKITI